MIKQDRYQTSAQLPLRPARPIYQPDTNSETPAVRPVPGERRIFADFSDQGVFVYQAFCNYIADRALEKGTFGDGFGRGRMTWIKPSFGWMMYRSGYGTKPNQERILRITLSKEGFLTLLGNAVLSEFDPARHTSRDTWQKSLASSPVRVQWDPDRDLSLNKIPGRRAIQIGIGPQFNRRYIEEWIVGLEDISAYVDRLRNALALDPKGPPSHPFEERLIDIPAKLQSQLGMD